MPEVSLHLLNESDAEGNTPLHLSVVYKWQAVLSLLLENKRVDKFVMNRGHLTAAELFYSRNQEISYEVTMTYYALQRYYKQPSQRHNIETKKKQDEAEVEESNDGAMYEVRLLVAVLVATVAFCCGIPTTWRLQTGRYTYVDGKSSFQMFLGVRHNRLLLLCNHSLLLVLRFQTRFPSTFLFPLHVVSADGCVTDRNGLCVCIRDVSDFIQVEAVGPCAFRDGWNLPLARFHLLVL
ncbi:Ankyrin repeat-containing domain protein [Raphanus sativus]|nr:Ankyrin repeat-containing domain protein [Raphanus sativus]